VGVDHPALGVTGEEERRLAEPDADGHAVVVEVVAARPLGVVDRRLDAAEGIRSPSPTS
jgi:hypothetical protein